MKQQVRLDSKTVFIVVLVEDSTWELMDNLATIDRYCLLTSVNGGCDRRIAVLLIFVYCGDIPLKVVVLMYDIMPSTFRMGKRRDKAFSKATIITVTVLVVTAIGIYVIFYILAVIQAYLANGVR